MSKTTENIFKDFHKYLDEHAGKNRSQEDVERLLKEFMSRYNGSLPDPVTEETAESSDDYLDMAYDAVTKKEAQKYAKKALELDPHNFDAESMVIELKSKDSTSLAKNYGKAVEKATGYMEKEGWFDDENIGIFWGLIETRPYMRLRGKYVQALLDCSMIGRAAEECRELLRLCEGDNMGIRYQLMHIYAYLEDEKAALALHKQFDSYDETQMLFPLSILYYKKGNFRKAADYLRRLKNENKDLRRFLRNMTGWDDDDEFYDSELMVVYRPGTIEELILEMKTNTFLFVNLDEYMEWALQQIKK